MGNKIITEKDFWMCSSGAVPAQLQGTRKSNKKSSGEVYITVADTATSSWIDFGCTKNMLLAAIITAVAVVVVVALIVGTGGVAAIGLIGMMAIGAAAGVAGGVIAAVDGALKCGQKNATARTWDGSKENMILTGTSAITGDRTMACSIGGVVKFAPEVKSWTHALALGGLNYITQLAGCALGGAGVGAGGFLVAGVAGGTLTIAAPTFSSVLSNVAGGFTGIWGGSRALFGLNSLANEHAYGNVQNAGDAGEALLNGGVPEIGMGQRIFTGQAQPSDYLLLLYLLNIRAKEPKPPVEEGNQQGDKDGNSNPKDEDGNQPKDEDGTPQNKGQGEESNTKPKDGEGNAYEEGQLTPEELAALIASRRQTAIEFYQKHNPGMSIDDIRSHISGIDFTKPVNVVKIPEGTELIQYTKVNTEGTPLRGDYYTTDSNATPNELGVSDKYNVQTPDRIKTQEVRDVTKETIKTSKDVEGLSSTSAEIDDTWSRIDEHGNKLPVHTDGGGSQIYIPKGQFK
ncbi:polymorphic toxin type 46 domain-containing protein [Chryseobacterium sp.]|uniref:polymorphic toxin type 46 domain-containing protein n=1 Tax=Chryseobacterium sp. TaxID=1871047 RepID=UPI00289A2E6F|nr:polymorphic toxin type 46 domain-containing protein [Chryseobacterium sp.]